MIVIFIIHHLMMYIIHYICVLLPGKYKPLLEMKCELHTGVYVLGSLAKFSARNYRTEGQKLSFLDQNYRILNF